MYTITPNIAMPDRKLSRAQTRTTGRANRSSGTIGSAARRSQAMNSTNEPMAMSTRAMTTPDVQEWR